MRQIILLSTALLLALNLTFSQNPKVACNPQDSLALVALYDSTGGDNWTHNDGWLTDNVSNWYGISLDANGRVISIDLDRNNLTGTIPPSIGSLDSLTYLNLEINHLSGKIPHEIGNLTKLTYLDLSFNTLSDSIPEEICNLTNLQKLSLLENDLTGPIPENIGNLGNLKFLILAQNNLTGTLPESITNMTNLTRINLCCNELSGTIPENIGNLTNLETFMIPHNQFTGQLPSSMANLTKLETLLLEDNNFTGQIPDWIYNFTNLTELKIGYNSFSGQISPLIGNLTKLTQLSLAYTNLTGQIPKQIGNLTNLTFLGLYNTNLSGPLPPELGNLTKLEMLWIYNTHITGSIPSTLGNLSSIEEIKFFHNNLTGNSADFSNCHKLQSILLWDNRLDFGDLDSMNIGCDTIDCRYSPQGPVLLFTHYTNDSVTFWVHVDGANNQYQWYKNNVAITNATDTTIKVATEEYTLYYCKITNPDYPDLILESYELTVSNDLYNIVFNIFDNESNPVPDAWVVIGNDSTQTNSIGQAVFQVHNGAYNYTIHKQGYINYSGTVQITNDNDTLNINLNRLHTLTFVVIDQNTNPIENAWIVLDHDSSLTNQYGVAQFDVTNGLYIYRVYKTGFIADTDTIIVQNNDSTITVTLSPTLHKVSFLVTDQDNQPLPDAWVVLGQDSSQTGSDGRTQFFVPNGTYNYRVYKQGYNQVTGSVTVDNNDIDIGLRLTQEITLNQQINSIQIYPNPASQLLTIKSNSPIEQIIIFDISGKKIKSIKASNKLTTINVSELKPNIYILKIFTKHGLTVARFTKL